jgi:hypothetical protein
MKCLNPVEAPKFHKTSEREDRLHSSGAHALVVVLLRGSLTLYGVGIIAAARRISPVSCSNRQTKSNSSCYTSGSKYRPLYIIHNF